MMICMKAISRDNTVFCNPDPSSFFLSSTIQASLRIFYLLPEDAILTMTQIIQEVDSICTLSGIYASLPDLDTPPQVDTSTYKNVFCINIHKDRCEQSWPIDERDQKKDGNRKPEKTKPDKSKKGDDKGLKKIKPPKRDGLVSILQKYQI